MNRWLFDVNARPCPADASGPPTWIVVACRRYCCVSCGAILTVVPSNVEKHGVTFEEGSHVFHDPRQLSRYDDEHSSLDEDRWVTLGRSRQMILVVVHTFDEHMQQVTVRIISAREATPRERRQYEDAP
jgi:uncharacterized protein